MDNKKTAYENAIGQVNVRNGEGPIPTADEILDANKTLDTKKSYARAELKIHFHPDDSAEATNLVRTANEYAAAIVKYYKATRSMVAPAQTQAKAYVVNDANIDSLHYDKFGKTAIEAMTKIKSYLDNSQNQIYWKSIDPTDADQSVSKLKKLAKHIWFELVVKNGAELVIGTTLQQNRDGTDNWSNFVAGLTESTEEDWGTKLGMKTLKYLASPLSQYVDFIDQIKDWDRWNSNSDGQIILSDKPNMSFYFDPTASGKSYYNGFNEAQQQSALVSLRTDLNAWN